MRQGSVTLGLLLAGLFLACSDDTVSQDARPPDSRVMDLGAADARDSAAADSQTTDSTIADAAVVDAAAAVSCQQSGGSPCAGGLTCECCGSVGPAPICICSKRCSSASDCAGTGLPECNTAPGGAEGICTPAGYNCCWMCQ